MYSLYVSLCIKFLSDYHVLFKKVICVYVERERQLPSNGSVSKYLWWQGLKVEHRHPPGLLYVGDGDTTASALSAASYSVV